MGQQEINRMIKLLIQSIEETVTCEMFWYGLTDSEAIELVNLIECYKEKENGH